MKKINKNTILTVLAVFFALGLTGPLVALAAGPLPVDLGTAGNFVILGKTTVTSVGSAVVTGDIGLSPAAASFITGFSLIADPSNTFSSSSQVTGKIYAANYAPPTPAYMTQAISDMQAAYTDAAGRTSPTSTDLAGGNIGGITFAPGLYKWNTDVNIPASGATSTDVTLSGGANDVWIFQMTGNLVVASGGSIPLGAKIVLTGGAQAKNVFWQVGGGAGATLGTSATFNGNILAATAVIMNTSAVLNGRALAQTAVTLAAAAQPSLPAGAGPATLRVVKLVINSAGTSSAVPSNFTLHVKKNGVDVAGSPLSGVSAPGSAYTLSAGTYVVSEDANSSYVSTFLVGDCDSNGNVTLASGNNKTCTIVNTDIPGPVQVVGGVVPLIGLLKVPNPMALPAGPGPVAYNYTVWNVGGREPLLNVTVTDDKCGPVVLLSGDVNNNNKLDFGESWKYSCTTTLATTTTNTAVATGYGVAANALGNHQIAIATAISTVVVGASTPAPLINITKVPSRLTPFPVGGGNVTYTYTVTNPGVVAMNNVTVADDKCGPVSRVSGDANVNNLLEPGESWVYTCSANVRTSTRNAATAEGWANGFPALGYAFSTVFVAATPLPSTGLSPEEANVAPGIILLSGALLVVLALTVTTLKKRKI